MNDWPAGVYYNFCAASTGSYCYDGESGSPEYTNAQYDICPRGWRMPTSGWDEEIGEFIGEYNDLYSAYDHQYVVFRNALRIPLSGYYYYDSIQYQGVYGLFWSSTWYYGKEMYNVNVDGYGLYPSDNFYTDRADGTSVRCIMNNS